MIAIIDYAMGNLRSVENAFLHSGAKDVCITSSAKDLDKADKIVLPGVGAFDDAMSELEKQGLVSVIKEQIAQKKPFLGICLGLQLLLETSQEAKINNGLGILKGQVVKFSAKSGQKVPHMGWNDLKVVVLDCPLLNGISGDEQVYFCHSYYPAPVEARTVAATTEYGVDFASVVWLDNVYGVQFHPEKSQDVGMRILKNFIVL